MRFSLMRIDNKRKKWTQLMFLVCIMCLGSSILPLRAQIPEPPDPPRLVNDFAGILSPSEQQDLENRLVALDDSTSTQVVIVVVRKLREYDISEFSYELGDKWGVGQQGKDNGIVITLSEQDRQVFIATGWGIEGYITDVEARRIIDTYMVPYFRQGNYYKGLQEGTRVITEILAGTFDPEEIERQADGIPMGSIIMLIIIVVIIMTVFRNRGGGGGQINRRGWSGPIIIGQGGGFGSSGGGFSGGGGFGGFGGGGFGGGGAGGSW